jgi:hypothetical protein
METQQSTTAMDQSAAPTGNTAGAYRGGSGGASGGGR